MNYWSDLLPYLSCFICSVFDSTYRSHFDSPSHLFNVKYDYIININVFQANTTFFRIQCLRVSVTYQTICLFNHL